MALFPLPLFAINLFASLALFVPSSRSVPLLESTESATLSLLARYDRAASPSRDGQPAVRLQRGGAVAEADAA